MPMSDDTTTWELVPEHIAIATPEFALIAQIDASQQHTAIATMVLSLVQNIADNQHLGVDTVVRVILDALKERR